MASFLFRTQFRNLGYAVSTLKYMETARLLYHYYCYHYYYYVDLCNKVSYSCNTIKKKKKKKKTFVFQILLLTKTDLFTEYIAILIDGTLTDHY